MTQTLSPVALSSGWNIFARQLATSVWDDITDESFEMTFRKDSCAVLLIFKLHFSTAQFAGIWTEYGSFQVDVTEGRDW